MSENTSRTELSALGEFGLIERLASRIQLQQASSVKGIGDDAAVIDPQGLHQVVTTDMLLEGVHFDLGYVPLKHLGYKAIVVNLSDVYAMNATPRQVVVSIALSNRFPVEAIDELYEGMLTACRVYGVDLVGGDTTSSTSGLIISVTAIGAAAKEDIVYRHGAKEGDLLVVSGDHQPAAFRDERAGDIQRRLQSDGFDHSRKAFRADVPCSLSSDVEARIDPHRRIRAHDLGEFERALPA